MTTPARSELSPRPAVSACGDRAMARGGGSVLAGGARPHLAHLALVLSFGLLEACSGDTTLLADSGLPPGCVNDDGCPTDQHCEGGMCAAGTGNACTTDAECGAGETCEIVTGCGATRCHGNTCVARTCTEDQECNGWRCEGGTCVEPARCNAAMPCPEGFECNANTGVCDPLPPEGCTMDEDCVTPGDICLAGTCQPATPCDTSADCPSDLRCIQMVCRAPCTMTSDCGPAFAWRCDTMTGECQQRCNNDNICPEQSICEGFICVPAECQSSTECMGADVECQGGDVGHGRCVQVFACDGPGGCPEGTACNESTNRCDPLGECVGDRGCEGSFYCEDGYCQPTADCDEANPCGAGLDCVGGVCVPLVCRGEADCTVEGESCISGVCQAPPAPTLVTQVRIITPAGVVRPGGTYRFTAVALDQTGAVVPGVTFMWTSTSTRVASIDADGLATGGATAGTTIIVASVFNGTTTISSPGVNLVNLGALAMGDVRVAVVGLSGGSPIAGASVTIEGTFGVHTSATDMSGVVVFAGIAPTEPFSVTVAHTAFDYVTVIGVDTNDLLIPLPPLTKPSVAGGIKGTVDFSTVTSQGALWLSLNGASIASPLVTFDAANLFGGNIFQIEIPNPQGGGTIQVPLAASNTLAVEFAGAPIPLKETYYAAAPTGLRAAWGLAGRIGLSSLGGGTGGGLDNIIGAILPYLQLFEHGVRPVVDVVAIPTVVDTQDIDGDGDSGELVPDYNGFPSVPLQPDTAQSLRYMLAVDNLPFVSGGNANTLIVIAGMILPSVGFVPLGLDGMQDGLGNGIVDPFVTKIAPPHGGLEVGEYAVLATAVRIELGGLPGPGATRLFVGDHLPQLVDLSDGWLDSPLDAAWDEAQRTVALPPIPNADMYRIALASDDGTWHVYAPAPDLAAGALSVPSAGGAVDRALAARVTVDAVDLEATATVSGLFDLATGGSLVMDRATRGFSRAVLAP